MEQQLPSAWVQHEATKIISDTIFLLGPIRDNRGVPIDLTLVTTLQTDIAVALDHAFQSGNQLGFKGGLHRSQVETAKLGDLKVEKNCMGWWAVVLGKHSITSTPTEAEANFISNVCRTAIAISQGRDVLNSSEQFAAGAGPKPQLMVDDVAGELHERLQRALERAREAEEALAKQRRQFQKFCESCWFTLERF